MRRREIVLDPGTLKFFQGLERKHQRSQQVIPGASWLSGSRLDRSTEVFQPGSISPQEIHRTDGPLLLARARHLAMNDPNGKAAVDAFVSNVLKNGIRPKPFEDPDGLIEAAWKLWGGLSPETGFRRWCDVTGQEHIYKLQELWFRELLVGGGVLLNLVEVADQQIPLTIEIIPEERLTCEKDGRSPMIRGGIEVDPKTGRHLAYWVTRDEFYGKPVRISAERCGYTALRLRAGQLRGLSLFQAVVIWLWRLGYYTDAEMFASQLKSNWAYQLKTDNDAAWTGANDEKDPEVTDSAGNRIERVSAGQILITRSGELKAVGPNVPGSDSIPWINLIQNMISVGVNLSYLALYRDFSKVTFSSARAAANADRRVFQPLQETLIYHFGNPIWGEFYKTCVRVGVQGFPAPREFRLNAGNYLQLNWQLPGWATVNPVDDAQAQEILLRNRLTSRQDEIATTGRDWEETFEKIETEEEALRERGLEPFVEGGDPFLPDEKEESEEN